MTSINSFFDKVYVITCDSFFDRHVYIKEHFHKNNIKFQFYVSIDNTLLINSVISSTEMSLSLSHLHCVIDAKLNGYKSILICEDDIQFVSNVEEKFVQFIKGLPTNWNFLQIGR